MKKVLLIFAWAAFTTTFAQENKNKTKETTVTKTAVKTDQGTDISTKSVTQTKAQVITLKDNQASQTNQSVVMKPTKVDTNISYDYDGNRFKFLNQKDEKGYRLMTVKDQATQQEYAIIKPTSQNGYYIMSKDGKNSFGYFNEAGDFVVEGYDAKNDVVVHNIYKINK